MIREKWSVLYTENVLKFCDLMLNSSSPNSAMGEGAAPLPAKLIQTICFAAKKVTGNRDTHMLQREVMCQQVLAALLTLLVEPVSSWALH